MALSKQRSTFDLLDRRDVLSVVVENLRARGVARFALAVPGDEVRAAIERAVRVAAACRFPGRRLREPKDGEGWSLMLRQMEAFPLVGTPDTFRHILFEFAAGGIQVVYDYIVKYFAHAVQRPHERAGVALLLSLVRSRGHDRLHRSRVTTGHGGDLRDLPSRGFTSPPVTRVADRSRGQGVGERGVFWAGEQIICRHVGLPRETAVLCRSLAVGNHLANKLPNFDDQKRALALQLESHQPF